MIDIDAYVQKLIDLLRLQFGERLCYVGLQGSYLRGEATEQSDIDIMTVIAHIQVEDLDSYRSIIDALPYAEKSCGFICGKEDLANWNPLEIHHLLNSTKDCFGDLRTLVPAYTKENIRNFVKISVGNLYHEVCHRYIHGDRQETYYALPGMYKGVFFILQNAFWLEHGIWVATKQELLQHLTGMDHEVLKKVLEFSCDTVYDFTECMQLLFRWCQKMLHTSSER